jgi:hypothetical protein
LDERKAKQNERGKHRGAPIIAALKQVEARRTTEDVARLDGHHLRLEIEVWRDGCVLQVGDPKKLTGLVSSRAEVRRLVERFLGSEHWVCGLLEIPRMTYPYQSRQDDRELREPLLTPAREKPRYGYRPNCMCPAAQIESSPHPAQAERMLGHSRFSLRRSEWTIDFANDVAASGHGRRRQLYPTVFGSGSGTLLASRCVTRVLAQIIDLREIPGRFEAITGR